jgi:hypothetical protein
MFLKRSTSCCSASTTSTRTCSTASASRTRR